MTSKGQRQELQTEERFMKEKECWWKNSANLTISMDRSQEAKWQALNYRKVSPKERQILLLLHIRFLEQQKSLILILSEKKGALWARRIISPDWSFRNFSSEKSWMLNSKTQRILSLICRSWISRQAKSHLALQVVNLRNNKAAFWPGYRRRLDLVAVRRRKALLGLIDRQVHRWLHRHKEASVEATNQDLWPASFARAVARCQMRRN